MPLSEEVVAALDALRRPRQSAIALLANAKRAGLDVTQRDVRQYLSEWVDDKGKELLAPKRLYLGHSAAQDVDERWMADLALYSRPVGRDRIIGFLLVVDVFSRGASAALLTGKSASDVLRAFQEICRQYVPDDEERTHLLRDLELTTDLGTEFQGVFRDWCQRVGIIWKTRAPGAKNDIAVLDRIMGTIKAAVKEYAINAGTSDWSRFVVKALEDHNDSVHEPIHGRPADMEENDEMRFLTMQDNAKKFAHNDANETRIKERVTRFGRFRPPLLTDKAFRERVFSRRYMAPREVASVRSGVVEDTTGKEHTLKLVQPLGAARRIGPAEVDLPRPPASGRVFVGMRRPAASGRRRLGPRRGPGGVRAEEPADPPPSEPPPPAAPTLPADPAARLALLKRYRNLSLKMIKNPLTPEEMRFYRDWEPAMPTSRAALNRAITEASR